MGQMKVLGEHKDSKRISGGKKPYIQLNQLDEVWSLDFDESWIVEFVRLGASDVVAPDLAVTESARDTPIVFCTESLQIGQLLCCCSQESRHATWKMCPQVGMRHKISGLL